MALMAGHQIAIRALHDDFVRAVWRGPTRDESHRGTNSGCDRAGNSHRQLARVLLNDPHFCPAARRPTNPRQRWAFFVQSQRHASGDEASPCVLGSQHVHSAGAQWSAA